MIKNILEDQLRKIYKNNIITLLLSKYGGKLINIFILAFYNKSISDPFTSIKAFDAKLLKSLTLYRKGFDLDFEPGAGDFPPLLRRRDLRRRRLL